jgi:ParB/RepB/Spo0J family partition protein
MKYKAGTALLSQIKTDDEKFRITTKEDLDSLVESIKASGLLSPPVLASPDNLQYTIVCGFRRISACLHLGWERIDARFVDSDASETDCAVAAIAENSSQRELNLIEMSRALNLLTETLPDGADIQKFVRQASLPLAPAIFSKVRPLCRLPAGMQQGILNGTLSLAMADRLGQMAGEDAREAYDLFCDIRAGLNVQREILDNAGESALRESMQLVEILRSENIMKIRASEKLDRSRKTGLIRKLLKKRRFPALTAAEDGFNKMVGDLGLTKGMKMVPPAGFEGPDYTLSLTFDKAQQLKEQERTIEKMLAGPVLKKILLADKSSLI